MSPRCRRATTPGWWGDEPVVVVDWWGASNYAERQSTRQQRLLPAHWGPAAGYAEG